MAAVAETDSDRWTRAVCASAAGATHAQSPQQQTEPIAQFCDFLELRVATKNMALLRRMTSDLFVGRDQTLQEFVELGVNLIAVLPFEELDPVKRTIAAQILFQQQQQRQSNRSRSALPPGASTHSVTAHSIALTFLEARVRTKNMPWLKCIYSEFCDGREDALCDFLRSGLEAISILPVRLPPPDPPRWLQFAAPAPSMTNHEVQMAPPAFASTASSSAVGDRHLRVIAKARDAPSGGSHVPPQLGPKPSLSPALHKSGKDATKGLAARPKKRGLALTTSAMHRKSPKRAHSTGAKSNDSTPSLSTPSSRDNGEAAPKPAQARDNTSADSAVFATVASAAQDESDRDMAAIRAEFFRIEATEPWTAVFHDHMALPPPILRFERLADTLQQFFVRHSRAVWERRFWLPLSRTRDVVLSLQRTKRQQSAMKIYIRRVIKASYKALGAAFFVALDAHRTPYDGWWYRVPVLDLGALYRAKGLAHTLAYLREQHTRRFPDVQAHMLTKTRGYHSWSVSMWSNDATVAHILHHIRVLKGTADSDKDAVLPSPEDVDGDDGDSEDGVDVDVRDVSDDGEQQNAILLNDGARDNNNGEGDDDGGSAETELAVA